MKLAARRESRVVQNQDSPRRIENRTAIWRKRNKVPTDEVPLSAGGGRKEMTLILITFYDAISDLCQVLLSLRSTV